MTVTNDSENLEQQLSATIAALQNERPSDLDHAKRVVGTSVADSATKLAPQPFRSWTDCHLYLGNSLDLLPSIDAKGEMVFADTPFNIGVNYGTWNDDLPWDEYLLFTRAWLDICVDALTPNGSIFAHVPDAVAAEACCHLKSRGLSMVNWLIWHYRFGVWRPGNFIPSKAHCLYFAKNKLDRIWNHDDILVPSDRATKYRDKRTTTTKTPGLRPPLDVFGDEIDGDGPNWGRIQGNNQERRPLHKNQLPEVYLERLIRAASRPGDLVIDPFCGSGTTATVARALGRRAITIEIDPILAASAAERIDRGPVRFKPVVCG